MGAITKCIAERNSAENHDHLLEFHLPVVWAVVYHGRTRKKQYEEKHGIEPSFKKLRYDSLVEGAVVQMVCGAGDVEGVWNTRWGVGTARAGKGGLRP